VELVHIDVHGQLIMLAEPEEILFDDIEPTLQTILSPNS